MGPLIRRIHRLGLVALALLFLPAAIRASDPVEQLGEALKIEPVVPGKKDPDLKIAAKRNKMIEAVIPALKTISQLRRAYFLKQWPEAPDEKPFEALDVDRYRVEIGAKLTKTIRSAAADSDPDYRAAVALLIAETAEAILVDEIPDRVPISRGKDKFMRSLTDAARELAKDKNLTVRQTGLNALGKITPHPDEALPILLDTLQKDEVGPRRIAAYALSDLVKNAYIKKLGRQHKLDLLNKVIVTAAPGLRDADEPVRGYCLQAISASAKVIADQFPFVEELTDEVKGKRIMKADLQKTMLAFRAANPQLLQALHDGNLNVRLEALQTLNQIGNARATIIHALQKLEPDQRLGRAELFKVNGEHDPLGGVVADLDQITDLLPKKNDVRLRRGAIDFLESLGDQADPQVTAVTQALGDEDRNVRLSAARTLRNMTPSKVSAKAIDRLAREILIERDPDLSAAAAAALETLGPAASDAVAWLRFVISNGEGDHRNFDVENRVAAMKALASIGGTAAQKAVPDLDSALRDDDVRVRREAAYTLGRVGRPADADPGLAQDAITALRGVLSDEDADVRRNAGEAILSLRK